MITLKFIFRPDWMCRPHFNICKRHISIDLGIIDLSIQWREQLILGLDRLSFRGYTIIMKSKAKELYDKQYYQRTKEQRKQHRDLHRAEHLIYDKERYVRLKNEFAKRARTLEVRFKSGVSKAKKMKREWQISFVEYKQLIKLGCYYCGVDLTDTAGTNLDRVDNKKGYTLNNVLPACGPCNESRFDHFTVPEWVAMIRALQVYRHNKENGYVR